MQQTAAPWVVEAQPSPHEVEHDVRDSRRRLAAALAAGAATHALFRHASLGANLAIWTLGAAAVSAFVFRGRRVQLRGWLAMGSFVAVALAPVWHASDWALAWALPAWFALLVSLPALIRDDVSFADVLGRPLRAVLHVPSAIASAAKMRGLRLPPSALGKAVVGVLLGAPFTLAFSMLLSFDDDFVAALGAAYARLGTAGSIAVCTLLWSITLGVAVAAQRRALLGGGWSPAYAMPPYRREGDASFASAPSTAMREAPWLSPLTWSLALGQVVLVLAGWVAISARHGFGGHAAVRDAGETYASYLHAGVLQLLSVAALSIGLVLSGHVLLKTHRSPRTAVLECALLALSGATLGSCFLRIHVYEQAYGTTLQRLGVGVVAFAVAFTLALTVVKSLRPAWRAYGTTTVLALSVVSGSAALFDADAFVAKTNLDRASAGRPLDARYLGSLSSDACAMESHAYLQAHAEAREQVAGGWANSERSDHAGWRSFRGLRTCITSPRAPAPSIYDQ